MTYGLKIIRTFKILESAGGGTGIAYFSDALISRLPEAVRRHGSATCFFKYPCSEASTRSFGY